MRNRNHRSAAQAPLPPSRDDDRPLSKTKIATGAAILLVLAGIYWWLWESGALEALGDEQALRDQIQRLGIWERWGSSF